MATSPTKPFEVYVLDFDANAFARLHTVEQNDRDRIEPLDGTPMDQDWRSMATRWVTNDGTRPIPDFSTLSGAPVFNARALEALGDLLEGRGELLRLQVEGADDHFAFNCTHVSDALDEGRSEFKRYESSGRIMRIVRHEFDADRLRGETLFRLAQKRKRKEYVTDAFRQRVEEAGLTGFLWDRLVWQRVEVAESAH